jgi:molecular chaperone HscC
LCRDNRKLGEFTISGLPPLPAGQVTIDVRFTYDLNGILEVETRVDATGNTTSAVFEQTPGRLKRGEVEKARAAMERLKFHPREALPNITALGRAEALYVGLIGPAREELAEAMAVFRAVLQAQEPKAIEAAREGLLALVAGLSRQ